MAAPRRVLTLVEQTIEELTKALAAAETEWHRHEDAARRLREHMDSLDQEILSLQEWLAEQRQM